MTISIALDAMGGDNAPSEVVSGAVQAARELGDVCIYLVGREDLVSQELRSHEWNGSSIELVPAEHTISMADSPVEALTKKRGSSIEVAMRLVREGKATACLSAGNTGACVAASSLFLGRLSAVKRPGIAVVFHTVKTPVVIIDVGANVYCKPEHLIQYGIMAAVYAEEIVGIENPKVGLLNIGQEDEKGHALAKQTYSLFQQTHLNFHGNVEGDEIFRGHVNVVVCDGFVGNIVLKISEGLAEHLLQLFMGTFRRGFSKLPKAESVETALEGSFEALVRKVDYSEYGGAPLLGVNGNVIIAHGCSRSKAIANAIKMACRMTEVNLNSRITEELCR